MLPSDRAKTEASCVEVLGRRIRFALKKKFQIIRVEPSIGRKEKNLLKTHYVLGVGLSLFSGPVLFSPSSPVR